MSQWLLLHPQLDPENDVYEGFGVKGQEPVDQATGGVFSGTVTSLRAFVIQRAFAKKRLP